MASAREWLLLTAERYWLVVAPAAARDCPCNEENGQADLKYGFPDCKQNINGPLCGPFLLFGGIILSVYYRRRDYYSDGRHAGPKKIPSISSGRTICAGEEETAFFPRHKVLAGGKRRDLPQTEQKKEVGR